MAKKNLFGYTFDAMREEFVSLGETSFRAKQLFTWIYKKRVFDFDQMTDISKSFRQRLHEEYCLDLPKIIIKQVASDGTVKALLEMEDGAKVESVLMRYAFGNAICISSEVGCPMACDFCASGILKRERKLASYEMMGELMCMNAILAEEGLSVTHIDVMGTGEPFDNYDNVMAFVRTANNDNGLGIGARKITVSTCGLPEGIRKYGKEGIQINLALSLHAPNDQIRNRIMPVSKAYPMNELIDALKEYQRDSGRRLTLEYILLGGLNDSLDDANELADLIHDNDLSVLVNLIPYNEVKEKPYKRSSKEAVSAFYDRLKKRAIEVTVRKEFGHDIDAACGQLRAKSILKGGKR